MKCKRCNYELTRGLVVGTAIGILAMLVVVAIMFGAGCRQAKPADPQEFIDRRVPEIKRLIAECQEFHDLPRVVPRWPSGSTTSATGRGCTRATG
jgi:hypothetical protein